MQRLNACGRTLTIGSPEKCTSGSCPEICDLAADLAEQHVDVDRLGVLAGVAAGEGEIAFEHPVHVVDVAS